MKAIIVCNFEEKIIQTQENGEKPHLGPDLGPLDANSGRQFFSKIWLCQSLDIMVKYNHVKYQKKVMIPFTLYNIIKLTQPAFTCSKLTIEILEQGVKYVQS